MDEQKANIFEQAKKLDIHLTNILQKLASQDEDTRKQGFQEYFQIMRNNFNHLLIIFILTNTKKYKIYASSVLRDITRFIYKNISNGQLNPILFNYMLNLFHLITNFLAFRNHESLYNIYWDSINDFITCVIQETRKLSYNGEIDPQHFNQFIEKVPEIIENLFGENPQWCFNFILVMVKSLSLPEHLHFFLEKFHEFFTEINDPQILTLAISTFFQLCDKFKDFFKDDSTSFEAIFNIYEALLNGDLTESSEANLLVEICHSFFVNQKYEYIPSLCYSAIRNLVPELIQKTIFIVEHDIPVDDLIPIISVIATYTCEENYERILSIDDLFPFLFLLMKIEDDNNFDNPYQKYQEYYSESHIVGVNQRDNVSYILLKLIKYAGIETIINLLPDLHEDYFEEYAYALTLMNSQIVSMNDSEAKSKAKGLILDILAVDIDSETDFFPAISQLLLSASYTCFFSDQQEIQQKIISSIREYIGNEENDVQKFVKHVALLCAKISTKNGVPIITQDEAIALYSEDPIYQSQIIYIISKLVEQKQISDPDQLISFVLDNFLIMTQEEIENQNILTNKKAKDDDDQLDEEKGDSLQNEETNDLKQNEYMVDDISQIIHAFMYNYPDHLDHAKLIEILNLCLTKFEFGSLVSEGIFEIQSIIIDIFTIYPSEISSNYIDILVNFFDSIIGKITIDIIIILREILCKKHDALDFWNNEMIQCIEKCFESIEDELDELAYLDIASLYGILIQLGRCDISIIQPWLDFFNEYDLTENFIKELGYYIIGASAILSGYDIETFLPFLLPVLESQYILREFDTELIHLAFIFLAQQNPDYNEYLEAFRARNPDTQPYINDDEYFTKIEYPKVQEYKAQNPQ